MEITVTMTAAFSDAGECGRMTRLVTISEQEWDGEIKDVLEAVFRNGQNDVQPVEGRPSVSTGDTISIADHPGRGRWRVMPVGFRPLDHGEPVVAPDEEQRRNLRVFGRLSFRGETVARIVVTDAANCAANFDDALTEVAQERGVEVEQILAKSRPLKNRRVFEDLTREEASTIIQALDCPAAQGFSNYGGCDGGVAGFGEVRAAMAALKNAKAAFDQAFEKGGE